eukprot:COSAG02_NODE_26279_length_636_cov_1.018622_1_plen_68_part_10
MAAKEDAKAIKRENQEARKRAKKRSKMNASTDRTNSQDIKDSASGDDDSDGDDYDLDAVLSKPLGENP